MLEWPIEHLLEIDPAVPSNAHQNAPTHSRSSSSL